MDRRRPPLIPLRVHLVLGDNAALVPLGSGAPRAWALSTPGGVRRLSSTRWLTRGLSSAQGWPIALERLLQEQGKEAMVAHLADPALTSVVFTDELEPGWERGVPRIVRLRTDLETDLPLLGLQPLMGAAILHFETMLEPILTRKARAVVRSLGFWPLLEIVPKGVKKSQGIEVGIDPESTARAVAQALVALSSAT